MRYRIILPILSLFIAIFSLFATPSVFAFDIPLPPEVETKFKENPTNKDLQEFCARRSGDQMNLETWYSGKCKDADNNFTSSFSGEGVGFSSIILLDLAERIQGKQDPDKSILDKIFDLDEIFKSSKIEATNNEDIQRIIVEERAKIFSQNEPGLLGFVGQGLSLIISNPPASSKNYIAYVSNNLKNTHVVSETFAADQGYGFSGLSGFLPIWRAVRNISYVIFVIFFIVYGFMMMFRVNINAKTVISIQLALPKLIFTLLIITFSYAIVGLMVDLMYVFFYMILSLLQSQNIILMDNIFVKASSGQHGAIFSFLSNSIFAIPASAIGILNLIIGGPTFITAIISFVPLFGGLGFIIGLVLSIAILISYVKLTWKLITAFLAVIISLVTAPIVLLGNALPGSTSFKTWIMGIIANLSVFPITMILLLFSYILMVQPLVNCLGFCTRTDDTAPIVTRALEYLFGVRNLSGGTIMTIPFISPPLASVSEGLFANSSDAILALFGVALLLMASKYVDIVRDALKVPPFKYGSAIGEALKSGFQYAPMTPGVGTRISESGAYQGVAKFGGYKTSSPSDAPWNTGGSRPTPPPAPPAPPAP